MLCIPHPQYRTQPLTRLGACSVPSGQETCPSLGGNGSVKRAQGQTGQTQTGHQVPTVLMFLLEGSPAFWPPRSLGPDGDRAGRDGTQQSFPFYGHRDRFPNKNWGTWAAIGFFPYLLNYFCVKIRSF